jgi:hypothetical protein
MTAPLRTTGLELRRAIMGIVTFFCCALLEGSQTFSPIVGHSIFVETQQPAFLGSVVQPVRRTTCDHVLPDDLLYRSYIAAPHEPRFASITTYDTSAKSWRWDTSIGGRVGLFRRDQPQLLNLDAWQIDLEGAAMTRLNPQLSMDVESADYRFGLLWTGRRENIAFKFGYFHVSSHVGDEYLLSNPTFERRNFVRESLVLGTSLQATPELRYYGEVAWAQAVSGGAKPWQFQLGAEFAAVADVPRCGAPFSAINVQVREEVDFAAGVNVMTGWQWKGPESGRTMRIGGQYFNGPTNQYEFLTRYDNQFGLGIWFDY